MKLAFVLAAFLSGASPALAEPTPADPPASEAAPLDPKALDQTALDSKALLLAHEILEIGMPPATRPAMFSGIMDAMRAQMRTAMSGKASAGDPEIAEIVNRSMDRMFSQLSVMMNAHLPDIFESMAHAYARQFSFDDLTQIRAFVGTSAGQHFFSRSALIVRDPDFMAANQRAMAEMIAIAPQLQQQMLKEIEAHALKHARKNPAGSHPG